ncbi:ATP-binding protein [uncultured Aquincola sp.]|uniref:AAA family ATPase n=1 Tax=uncultured Aquincola sp. TaxID=886556 RepID=UPI0032B21154
MLQTLKMTGVGPASELGPITFSPRMNFLTGDNGLGKSFFLDVAWWALTRTWARGVPASPQPDAKTAKITFSYTKATPPAYEETVVYKHSAQSWPLKQGRPPIPGVVIYAGVDGSFSVWDPARNYWTEQNPEVAKVRAFNFSPEQVWLGLPADEDAKQPKAWHCKGLISDWVRWQGANMPEFSDLVKVLDALSPSGVEKLTPGQPMRVGDDVTDQPSLRMPYAQDVPLVHASAGMRRIAALAYLLVWTWREHERACARQRQKTAKEVIFLIDEVECHLHPQWQRRVVPALLSVMQALTGRRVPVQLIVATHSPLVLASVEPTFDAEQDTVFSLRLNGGQAVIEPEPWAKQGDVTNWLVSPAFGLEQARSVEAEAAIEAAEALMRGATDLPANLNTHKKIDQELRRVLPGHDTFWPRWIVSTQRRELGS